MEYRIFAIQDPLFLKETELFLKEFGVGKKVNPIHKTKNNRPKTQLYPDNKLFLDYTRVLHRQDTVAHAPSLRMEIMFTVLPGKGIAIVPSDFDRQYQPSLRQTDHWKTDTENTTGEGHHRHVNSISAETVHH